MLPQRNAYTAKPDTYTSDLTMKETKNNLLTTETSAAEPATGKDNSMRRRFIVLIAILTALSLLTAAFATFVFLFQVR